MPYRLAFVALSPVLIGQGRRVKRDTPRLPEPDGARSGTQGTGQPLRVLIMGDSAAAGVGVTQQSEALAGQLINILAQRFCVSWQLHATTGHTLAQVLADLRQLPAQPVDLVLTSFGVNDVTALTPMWRWKKQLHQLTTYLDQHFGQSQLILSALPPMQHFPALPQPLRWVLGQRAAHFNRLLRQHAQQKPRCIYAEIALPFAAEYMAADGFHPSQLTYGAWAQAVVDLMDDFSQNKQA